MFQNLRKGHQIPVLIKLKDKEPQLVFGKIINDVQQPHFVYPQPGQMGAMQPMQPIQSRVVDITIEIDGKTYPYSFAENTEIGYPDPQITIASTKEAMIREVEALKNQSDEVIKSVEYHRTVFGACEQILSSLNPSFAEKKEQDQKITDMGKEIGELKQAVSTMGGYFEKFLKQFGDDNHSNKK